MLSFFVNMAMTLYVRVAKLFRKPVTHNYLLQVDEFTFAIPKPKFKASLTKRVYLISEGNVKVDITQPPGTKYHYTANELGGTNFIICDINDEKHTNNKHIITMQGDEHITVNYSVSRRSLDE